MVLLLKHCALHSILVIYVDLAKGYMAQFTILNILSSV